MILFNIETVCKYSPRYKTEEKNCRFYDDGSVTCRGVGDFNYCGKYREYLNG
jgi:hypothetical protein